MTTHSLLLLPGDGIGPEVMAEVERLVAFFNKKGKVQFETETALVGGASIDKHGVPLTSDALEKAEAADAIVFGAVGGPKWDKVRYEIRPEAGLLRLRKELDLFANLRPAICYAALAEASTLKREHIEGLDILILRELTGGTYFGEPKEIVTLENGQKRAVDTTVYTTHEIERIARVAFDLARKRRNKVHSADKRNVMKTGVLWHEVVTAVHTKEAKDVELNHILADACAMQLVRNPKQFDVIVCDNLFGDMLSDEAAMLTGSIGMLPSASLGARHRRQGPRQPDRGHHQLRHGAALLLRAHQGGRPDRQGDRRRARPRLPHRRHHAAQHAQGRHRRDGQGDPGGGREAGGLRAVISRLPLTIIGAAHDNQGRRCCECRAGEGSREGRSPRTARPPAR